MIELLAQINNDELIKLPSVNANDNQLANGLAVAFGVAAAIAVLSIVIAGFNFATSEGDPDKISRSKRNIVLSLIGLAITLSAEFIVLTVLGRF